MPWPTPLDYQTALQNPAASLADPELRGGKVERDPIGLPKPRTGTFASVYKVQCGQRNWAIRCFLMDFHDQQERYTAISRHLARVALPYMVGFEYIAKGILVGKQWYPILKMEWVEGERLDRYIEKNLHNPSLLLSLARQWIEMVKKLRQASIAHGDFQHGNIFVEQGRLRLIDYDGMFVPALKGRLSHETGHRNYQHPKRGESNFDLYLDNFSAWVVYLSLIALSVDAQLWQLYKGGDECLLFRSHDFEQPGSSSLFKSLEKSPDKRVRSTALQFLSLLSMNPEQVPFLESRIPLSSLPATSLPGWLKDHIKPSAPRLPGSTSITPPRSVASPSWVFDFLDPEGFTSQSARFENSVLSERLILALSLLNVILLSSADPLRNGITLIGMIGILLLNLLLWIYRYHSEPAVEKLASLQSNLKTLEKSINSIERQIKACELDKTELRNRFKTRLTQMGAQKKAMEEIRKTKLEKSQQALLITLKSIENRRLATRQQEARAVQKIQKEHGSMVARLSQQIGTLIQVESEEIRKALQDQQQEYIYLYLKGYPINKMKFPGIGEILITRLVAAGISTAADVSYDQLKLVNGIGHERASSLVRWKQDLEAVASAGKPSSLRKTDLAAISTNYQDQRIPLETQRDLERRRQETAEKAIRQSHAAFLQRLVKEDESARAKAQRQAARINHSCDKALLSKENDFIKISKKTEAGLQRENDLINEARRDLFDLRWKQEQLKRQLVIFDEVSFSNYIKRLLQVWNP